MWILLEPQVAPIFSNRRKKRDRTSQWLRAPLGSSPWRSTRPTGHAVPLARPPCSCLSPAATPPNSDDLLCPSRRGGSTVITRAQEDNRWLPQRIAITPRRSECRAVRRSRKASTPKHSPATSYPSRPPRDPGKGAPAFEDNLEAGDAPGGRLEQVGHRTLCDPSSAADGPLRELGAASPGRRERGMVLAGEVRVRPLEARDSTEEREQETGGFIWHSANRGIFL